MAEAVRSSTPAPASAPAALRVRVHAALIAVQVAFASLAVVGKVVVRTLEPGSLALLRLAGAAIVIGPLALRQGAPRLRIPRRDLLAIVGCAALGIFGNQVLFLYGLRLTSAVNATVLIATVPVFTVAFAILARREPARPATIAGVAIALAGVLFLLADEAISIGGPGVLGDLLVLANSLAYAVYLVLVRDLVARHGSLPVVAIGFGVGAILALPIGAPALVAQAGDIGLELWLMVLYLVLVATVFTYLANAWALRYAPSSLVAIYIYLQPTMAALLAWLVLGETPTARVLVAVLAVFAGIRLVAQVPSRAATPARAGVSTAADARRYV